MHRHLLRKWIARSLTIALLLGVVVAGFTFWTRGDSRFIGKWNIGSRCPDESAVTPWGVIEFRSNGTAVMQNPDGTGATIPFPWSAQAAKLTFGEKSNSNPGLMEEIRSDLRYLWSGSTILGLDEATYDILLMTPGNVELLEPGDECSFILTKNAE